MDRVFNQYGLLLLGSGIMALLMLMQLPQMQRTQRVVQRGRVVTVEVVRGSTFGVGTRAQSYMDFRYAGQAHSLRVPHAFRQRINNASTAELLHLPEYPDLFLPPDYDSKSQTNSLYWLLALFVGSMGYSLFMLLKKPE